MVKAVEYALAPEPRTMTEKTVGETREATEMRTQIKTTQVAAIPHW